MVLTFPFSPYIYSYSISSHQFLEKYSQINRTHFRKLILRRKYIYKAIQNFTLRLCRIEFRICCNIRTAFYIVKTVNVERKKNSKKGYCQRISMETKNYTFQWRNFKKIWNYINSTRIKKKNRNIIVSKKKRHCKL